MVRPRLPVEAQPGVQARTSSTHLQELDSMIMPRHVHVRLQKQVQCLWKQNCVCVHMCACVCAHVGTYAHERTWESQGLTLNF
eukprot:scaffold1589_cov19-Tisochrysis_lutea.AAC.3